MNIKNLLAGLFCSGAVVGCAGGITYDERRSNNCVPADRITSWHVVQ